MVAFPWLHSDIEVHDIMLIVGSGVEESSGKKLTLDWQIWKKGEQLREGYWREYALGAGAGRRPMK